MSRPFAARDVPTLICAFRGHHCPAAEVARLRPGDAGVGVDLADGRRLARCLRCDVWRVSTPPPLPRWEVLPPFAEMELPRRGKQLREALVLRLIAVDRAFHCVIFTLLAVALTFLELHLGGVRRWAQNLLDRLDTNLTTGGQGSSRSFLVRSLNRLLHLRQSSLRLLLLTAAAYAIVEGTEAVGLWLEKRWAEYLTAVATAGFLPFEIYDLTKRVTVVRLATLILNLAILVYLLWRKHLFGLGPEKRDEGPDPELIFAPPVASR